MRANVDLRFELPRRAPENGRTTGVLALLNGTAPVAAPGAKEIDQWAREAAEGSPQAQYELAKALATGATLSADNRTAVKWLKKAAEKEHLASQHLWGYSSPEVRASVRIPRKPRNSSAPRPSWG